MATRVIIASETSNKSCKINNLTSRRETILLLLGVSGLSIFEFMTLWTDSALLYQPLEPSPAFLNEGSNDDHSVRASESRVADKEITDAETELEAARCILLLPLKSTENDDSTVINGLDEGILRNESWWQTQTLHSRPKQAQLVQLYIQSQNLSKIWIKLTGDNEEEDSDDEH
ncbi:hypothetical protein YC2023_028698 [Brassica napus]